MDILDNLLSLTAFDALTVKMVIMWGVVFVLFYFAIYKKYEPLLLVPIAFGALMANLPTKGIMNAPPGDVLVHYAGVIVEVAVKNGQTVEEGAELFKIRYEEESGEVEEWVHSHSQGKVADLTLEAGRKVYAGEFGLRVFKPEGRGGLYYYIQQGIHLEIFPPLIFLGVGALTDFGPMIAYPRTLMLGAAAQFGVFFTFICATGSSFFTSKEAAAIGIIGGADGPTSIFIANNLAPHLLAPVAVSAYSYMALVPLIQPPIMRLFTSEKERKIRMKSLRSVRKEEKLLFALLVTVVCVLLVPDASALICMLMLGNFLRECGVAERLVGAAQNEIINVVTILLGTSVGITMTGDRFLNPRTLMILGMGVVAFGVATSAGLLMAKLMNVFSKEKINPLIGSAGVSAVPMAARVSQVEGQKADPSNFLLMHAMGPNVAGVIGTAMVAGYFIATLGG
jgi:oxaloacetate decarboxylase beta subunit